MRLKHYPTRLWDLSFFLSFSICIEMKSSEILPLSVCANYKNRHTLVFIIKSHQKEFLPCHGTREKLALTNFISKSSMVQILINTEEP